VLENVVVSTDWASKNADVVFAWCLSGFWVAVTIFFVIEGFFYRLPWTEVRASKKIQQYEKSEGIQHNPQNVLTSKFSRTSSIVAPVMKRWSREVPRPGHHSPKTAKSDMSTPDPRYLSDAQM